MSAANELLEKVKAGLKEDWDRVPPEQKGLTRAVLVDLAALEAMALAGKPIDPDAKAEIDVQLALLGDLTRRAVVEAFNRRIEEGVTVAAKVLGGLAAGFVKGLA